MKDWTVREAGGCGICIRGRGIAVNIEKNRSGFGWVEIGELIVILVVELGIRECREGHSLVLVFGGVGRKSIACFCRREF